MRRAVWLETRLVVVLATAGLVASLVIFVVLAAADNLGQGSLTEPREAQAPREGPAVGPWEPTGDFRTSSAGVGLTVLSFSVSPERMSVLFALDGPSAAQPAAAERIYLLDDRGKEYAGEARMLGTALGVTAGVLVTETYDGIGASLTLAMDRVSISSANGEVSDTRGSWRVTFVDNYRRGAPDYTVNGKIAPEVTKFGDVTISKAGGSPSMSYITVLVNRGGQQSAVYGTDSADGFRGLSEAEFRAKLLSETGAEELPVPPDFPQPAEP